MIRTGAGHVTVTAEDTDRTTVELIAARHAAGEDAVTEAGSSSAATPSSSTSRGAGAACSGRARRSPSRSRVRPGTDLQVEADSAGRATPPAPTPRPPLTTGSGDIAVEAVTGTAKLKSGSGAVTAGQVGETLRGDHRLGRRPRSTAAAAPPA